MTAYPMMHIASQDYYERIESEIERCEYVLVEGVSWRRDDKRRPLYDLVARNLGLAAQENALRYPQQARKINLDMQRSEFRTLFFRLPVRYVLMFLFLRPLLWAMTLPPSFRRTAIVYGLLRRRRQIDRSDDTDWKRLIVGRRDQRIVENLERFCQGIGACEMTTYAAIIFGAGHMPAISAGLRRLGFSPGSRRWVEILRIPPESHRGAPLPTPPPTIRTRWS